VQEQAVGARVRRRGGGEGEEYQGQCESAAHQSLRTFLWGFVVVVVVVVAVAALLIGGFAVWTAAGGGSGVGRAAKAGAVPFVSTTVSVVVLVVVTAGVFVTLVPATVVLLERHPNDATTAITMRIGVLRVRVMFVSPSLP
jgi:hypothetical protein